MGVCSLWLSHGKDILINLLARIPITPNQESTLEMRDEILSCVGAQTMDTSGHQVSNRGDDEFHWEDPNLDINAVF